MNHQIKLRLDAPDLGIPFRLMFYYTPLDLDPTTEIKSGELTEGIRVSRPSPVRYSQRWTPAMLPKVSDNDEGVDEDQSDEESSMA
jgi:hypothetical protein